MDELVAAVDALSRDAAQQLLRTLLTSSPAAAAFSRLEALGPLRPLLLPLPTPLELLSRLAPAVRLSPDDEEALAVVRGLLSLTQRLQAPPAGYAAGDAAAAVQVPFGPADAVRFAGELRPLLPELAPGLAHTGDLLVRAVIKRVVQRVTDAASDVAAAGQSDAPAFGDGPVPVPAFGFVADRTAGGAGPSVVNAVGRAGGAAAESGGALTAGQVLVGLAAAPLMLALAPLGLLSEMQKADQQRRRGA